MGPQLWGSILKHEDLPLNLFIAHKQYSSTQYSKETTKISLCFSFCGSILTSLLINILLAEGWKDMIIRLKQALGSFSKT